MWLSHFSSAPEEVPDKSVKGIVTPKRQTTPAKKFKKQVLTPTMSCFEGLETFHWLTKRRGYPQKMPEKLRMWQSSSKRKLSMHESYEYFFYLNSEWGYLVDLGATITIWRRRRTSEQARRGIVYIQNCPETTHRKIQKIKSSVAGKDSPHEPNQLLSK